MIESSIDKAINLIGKNDPEVIRSSLYRACACMGAIEGEPLCRCKMLKRELGNRISLFALLKLGKIVHLKNGD